MLLMLMLIHLLDSCVGLCNNFCKFHIELAYCSSIKNRFLIGFLCLTDPTSSEPQRGPTHVGVSVVLHQGRRDSCRLGFVQHHSGHPAQRAAHTERALYI